MLRTSSDLPTAEVALQYRPGHDRVINIGYRYRKGQLEQSDVSAIWGIAKGWHAFVRFVYSLKEDSAIERSHSQRSARVRSGSHHRGKNEVSASSGNTTS